MMRHNRLLRVERLLLFLDAARAGAKRFKNPDADGMRKRPEEIGLEELER